MDKAKIDRINYLARQSRERELQPRRRRNSFSFATNTELPLKRGLMSELDRVYVVDDKGNQQKLIIDNKNK